MAEDSSIPLRVTHAQRRAVAGLLPHLGPRLLLDSQNQRTLEFNEQDLKAIATACRSAISHAKTGMVRNSLRHTIEAAEHALKKYGGRSIHRIPTAHRLFQLRILLKEIRPEIWRRVQVKDCTLDRLHLHIQLAMGWEDYHLYQFTIDSGLHGVPEQIFSGFLDDPEVIDSHRCFLAGLRNAGGGFRVGSSLQIALSGLALVGRQGTRPPDAVVADP